MSINNIYLVLNRQTSHKYIGYDTLPLNKVWGNILKNHGDENTPLANAIKHYSGESFTIRILEEVHENKAKERVDYWVEKYNPEYNISVIEHKTKRVNNKESYKKGDRRWGYQRKKKPKKHDKNVIKCRNIETGKIRTFHGWVAAAEYVNGKASCIRRSITREGTAYGHKWWIHKHAKNKKQVYGVHKNGHVTPVFDSISEAMRSFNEEDRGKGICTSIKWGSRWKGYLWYYSETKQ